MFGSDGGLNSLLIGLLIANLISFLILNYGIVIAKLSIIRSFNAGSLLSTIKLYKSFPLFNAPHSFVSKSSSEAPVFILMTFFGSEIVGFFSLARKVLSQPIYILGKNIGLIFHERAGNSVRSNITNTSDMVNKTILYMSLVIIPISFSLFIFVEDLFSLVFGAKWVFAGTLSILMIPLMMMRFIAAPIEYIFLVTNNSMQLLIIHLAKTFFGIAGLMIGVFFNSVSYAIFFYSIFSCFIYAYSITKAQKYSKIQQVFT
jgi:O-antigen/teichoic acid export membrane protein